MTTDNSSNRKEEGKEDELEDDKDCNSVRYEKYDISNKLSRFLPNKFLIKSLDPGIITGLVMWSIIMTS